MFGRGKGYFFYGGGGVCFQTNIQTTAPEKKSLTSMEINYFTQSNIIAMLQLTTGML
jgi:hypothetical protein